MRSSSRPRAAVWRLLQALLWLLVPSPLET
jgi:hypothetical protein